MTSLPEHHQKEWWNPKIPLPRISGRDTVSIVEHPICEPGEIAFGNRRPFAVRQCFYQNMRIAFAVEV